MSEETLRKIKKPIIKEYLKIHSYEYQQLFRRDDYIKELEQKAKEYFHQRPEDILERFQNKWNLFQTIMSAIE